MTDDNAPGGNVNWNEPMNYMEAAAKARAEERALHGEWPEEVSQTYGFIDVVTRTNLVEFSIRHDGLVVWLNVNGVCVARIQNVDSLTINDARPKNYDPMAFGEYLEKIVPLQETPSGLTVEEWDAEVKKSAAKLRETLGRIKVKPECTCDLETNQLTTGDLTCPLHGDDHRATLRRVEKDADGDAGEPSAE